MGKNDTISRLAADAALCIIEEIVDSNLPDAPVPWQEYRDTHGIAGLRYVVLQTLAQACSDAWKRAEKRYEKQYAAWQAHMPHFAMTHKDWRRAWDANPVKAPEDLGSFDYEFVPVWLRECVDWSDLENGPRVRGVPI